MVELPKTFVEDCGWLTSGSGANDLVVSSRVRLARNIEGFPFSQWASSSDLKRISQRAKDAIHESSSLSNANIFSLEDMESMDRRLLAERYMISREMMKSGIERYVAINPHQTASVMINEEDHLRLQVLACGSDLRGVWEEINRIDDELESNLTYSFSNTYGYLTACPTNVGTGIRCSVMVHLPALMMSRKIEQVLNAVTQMGLTVRGLSGEGSEIAGNLFQISNQWTLGISEEETIEKIERILKHIIEQERKAETKLMEDSPTMVKDKVWRAYATLKYAHLMSSNEAIELLSAIRLGRGTGIINWPGYEGLNEMIIWLRPAHLQKKSGKILSTSERDMARADMIREWIETQEKSAGNN